MVTITVRKKHFDIAMAAILKEGLSSQARVCLIAQAVREVFPKKSVAISLHHAKVNKKQFVLPRVATRLIERFDRFAFDKFAGCDELTKREKESMAKFRDSLPVTFALGE